MDGAPTWDGSGDGLSRRRLLQAGVAAGVAGTAGCLESLQYELLGGNQVPAHGVTVAGRTPGEATGGTWTFDVVLENSARRGWRVAGTLHVTLTGATFAVPLAVELPARSETRRTVELDHDGPSEVPRLRARWTDLPTPQTVPEFAYHLRRRTSLAIQAIERVRSHLFVEHRLQPGGNPATAIPDAAFPLVPVYGEYLAAGGPIERVHGVLVVTGGDDYATYYVDGDWARAYRSGALSERRVRARIAGTVDET